MMRGFFSKQQTESTQRPDGRTYSCVSCGLMADAKTPRMEPYGQFKRGILNIGEAPGKVEDEIGQPWQGKMGQFLKISYREVGVDLFEDCLNMNACNCRPLDEEGNNRTPTNYEIDCCRRMIIKAIREHRPHVIALFGNAAVYSVIGHRWKRDLGGISKWRGWTIPDRHYGAWICPTFHPSFISRGDDPELETIWGQDLERITEISQQSLPAYQDPEIEIIEDLSPLNDIDSGRVAFDYETTGIKPHAPGHRIVCASVADNENHAYAFMMPPSPVERRPLINLLTNPSIAKMAHHMKFEDIWTRIRLHTEVQGWDWDSILASHILDNRTGVTSLKFQTYVNFGVADYSSEIDPYLTSGTNDGNAKNRLDELIKTSTGRDKLLRYCALDSAYEYRLAMKQISLIKQHENNNQTTIR